MIDWRFLSWFVSLIQSMFLIISGDAACLYVILFYSIINLVQNLNTYDIKKNAQLVHGWPEVFRR